MLDAGAFVVEEGEEAIVDDGAADASAKLVLIVLCLASLTALGEVVRRIEKVVTEIFEGKEMKAVVAAHRVDRESCSGRAAILGRIGIRDDGELLDCVNGRMRGLRA